jgi:DNA polymerase kappa
MSSNTHSICNPYRAKRRRFDAGSELPTHTGIGIDRSTTASSENVSTRTTVSDLVISASDKAGMDGIDRDAIDAIIMKESGNSLFMQQQRRRDEKVNIKIESLREKLHLQAISDADNNWRQALERQIDAEIPQWLATRPSRSYKVVVDMDMFYMACEMLSRPEITPQTPACVGGKSMICTSNYAARRYGVRAAMPGYIGEALVRQLSKGKEQLVFCKLNFPLYQEKSHLMRNVLSEFDPHLTAYSLDDVYLDLGPYILYSLMHPSWTHAQIKAHLAMGTDDEFSVSHYPEQLLEFTPASCLARAEQIVAIMRQRVFEATGGLTCSAGIAPNFLLAKIASDRIKPNGQLAIASDHESITKFLYPLPIRKVSGIGRVTEKILKAFGITTVAQLYQERALIRFLFDHGSSTATFLLKAGVGCSSSDGAVSEEAASQQKGISRERTMQSGKPWAELMSKLDELARLVSEDLKKKSLKAQTVTVKVKLHTFDCLSRSRSLPRDRPLQSAEDLLLVASELLGEIRQKEAENTSGAADARNQARAMFSVRLLGIRCSNLQSDSACTARINQVTIDRFLRETMSLDASSTASIKSLEVARIDSALRSQENVTGQANPENTLPDAPLSTSSIVRLQCPVCDKHFEGTVEAAVNYRLNDHMDTCLSSTVVRDAIHEESVRAKARLRSKTRARGLYDFFVSSS